MDDQTDVGQQANKDDEFLVVGIGASAGGIKALQEFFAKVPAESGMVFVVILHLSPEFESKLSEILQVSASIPVTQVEQEVRVEPNHVYVITPNKSLTMVDGSLTLSEVTRIEERRAPIDIFFRTLAESHTRRAVSVILSGTGADGSMGLKRVKERGGISIVQDPNEAEYSDMPRNSIATSLVDYVLPVARIPGQIIAYKEHLQKVRIPEELEAELTAPPPVDDETALRDIITQLRVRIGHDFTNYKRSTVLRRVARRMTVHELPVLKDYARFLRENNEEVQSLLKDLLISVTNFFRDGEAFKALEEKVIPALFNHKHANTQVRVWVAGCATGEEAYSIAMLLAEYSAQLVDVPAVQVFATDIDVEAIAFAREGLYSLNDAADVSPERLRRFFVKEDKGYRVRRELREMVLFAHHNVLKDPPFSHLDLLTCRNFLIYLNNSAQSRVMDVAHFALNPGGFLMLGSTEFIDGAGDLFLTIDKQHRLFQSRAVLPRYSFPIPERSNVNRGFHSPPGIRRVPETRTLERLSYAELHQRLLEEYAAPSVVINDDYDIMHMSERAGRFMQFGGGEPSFNLLKLIKPELRLELRTALIQAAQSRTNIVIRNIQVNAGEKAKAADLVNIMVRPVLREDDPARGFFMVLFEEAQDEEGKETTETQAAQLVISGRAEPIAHQLEAELIRTKSLLRSTIQQSELQNEELKASNEELQAINEELRSTAEELETSKEELQSINEELTTVNQELKVKVDELGQTNNDIRNFIDSADIGTIFLDRALHIKLFTPRARHIFNLIPADVGRPLTDIRSNLVEADLIRDVEHILEKLCVIEREVRTQDGRVHLMQISPYRIGDDRINGVVITFVNITERKKIEEQLRQSEERLRLMVESVTDYAILTTNLDGCIESWNSGAERTFGYSNAEAIGQHISIIFTPEDRHNSALEQEMQQAREKGRAADECWYLRKDGSRLYMSGSLFPFRDNNGALIGYVKIARDLTELRRASDELKRAKEETETKVYERTAELADANKFLQNEVDERKRSEAVRFSLLRQLVTSQEDERRRIARDLHDHLGQQLTALRLKIAALKEGCQDDPDLCGEIERVQNLAAQIDSDVDFLAWELRPAVLDDFGLAPALGNFVHEWSAHFDVPAEFHTTLTDVNRFPPEIETILYRITQEALNNITKHANAKSVSVILEERDGQAMLIIEDDGDGFELTSKEITDPSGKRGSDRGLGLIGMRERAALAGGTLQIESRIGSGTTVFTRIPLSIPAESDLSS